jgi:hypothetical protein
VSSIYKNGEWRYYQTFLTLPDGSKRKIQTSLRTKDRKEGRKKQKELDSRYLMDRGVSSYPIGCLAGISSSKTAAVCSHLAEKNLGLDFASFSA